MVLCVHGNNVWNRYWQGNAFPNGTDCAPGTPDNQCDAPYKGSFLSADCGDIVSLEGGCLYNIRKDAHVSLLISTQPPRPQARSYDQDARIGVVLQETTDLASEMPDVVHSLKARYLELR